MMVRTGYVNSDVYILIERSRKPVEWHEQGRLGRRAQRSLVKATNPPKPPEGIAS